jgi:hypothetical protein
MQTTVFLVVALDDFSYVPVAADTSTGPIQARTKDEAEIACAFLHCF